MFNREMRRGEREMRRGEQGRGRRGRGGNGDFVADAHKQHYLQKKAHPLHQETSNLNTSNNREIERQPSNDSLSSKKKN